MVKSKKIIVERVKQKLKAGEEAVDKRLLKADEDVRELLDQIQLQDKRTPMEEELDGMHQTGRGYIKGRKL